MQCQVPPAYFFGAAGPALSTRVDPASGQPGQGLRIGEAVRAADAHGGGLVPAAGAPVCRTTRHRGSRRLGQDIIELLRSPEAAALIDPAVAILVDYDPPELRLIERLWYIGTMATRPRVKNLPVDDVSR
jgi:hypothetical protein